MILQQLAIKQYALLYMAQSTIIVLHEPHREYIQGFCALMESLYIYIFSCKGWYDEEKHEMQELFRLNLYSSRYIKHIQINKLDDDEEIKNYIECE